jgi:DNA-binding SARP family transcriptional activator
VPGERTSDLQAIVRARLRQVEARQHRRGARPRLEVDLLGPVQVRWRGRPIPSGGVNADALLALLALRGGLRGREEVSTELWPEGGGASLTWLRQAIWRLRRAIGNGADEVLLAGHDRLGLAPELDLDVDVAAFEAALAARPSEPARAVSLYRGDLLEGSVLECFSRDRERLADLFENALGAMASSCLARGDLDGAEQAATRLVGRDPLREDAHALLITIHGIRGERSRVVRRYRRLRGLLAQELAVAPLPETELAYAAALEAAERRSRERVADRAVGAGAVDAEAGGALTASSAKGGRAASRDARETTG